VPLCTASDGHPCRSLLELDIDDCLNAAGLAHECELEWPWHPQFNPSGALAWRSKIVLACADGLHNEAVGEQLRCHPDTVGKWCARFSEHRLDGLHDEPPPGRPRTITVDQVEEVVVATLESAPKNATHWTRSKMASRSGLAKSTIGANLAILRPQAAPGRRIQAVQRPAVYRQALRHRRALPEPARGGGGVVRG
jgi:hypothetical protein